MRFSVTLVATALLAASAIAAPSGVHVIHEKRDYVPDAWAKRGKLDSRAILPIKIALTQSNLHRGEDVLMEVSDPTSPKYGEHWTADQVADFFAPAEATVNAVKEWLTASGIDASRISQSRSKGWLNFKASVAEAERLLKTEYYGYEHESGQPHVACHEYSIPSHLREHIDFITPTVHFDAKVTGHGKKVKRADPAAAVKPKTGLKVGSPNNGFLPKVGAQVSAGNIFKDLQNCDKQITPVCLQALYRFPPQFHANPGNSYGIVEYTPQAYLQSDLNRFFANFSPPLVGKPPKFVSIDGGVDQTTNQGFDYNGESNLDLEYAMALVYPLNVTLFQTGDLVQGASFNNFLDGIDASYCTYEGGDDPTQDGIYPASDCGTAKPTNVISTSYGYNEADLTPFYEQRQCNEYMKLGLQGTTILYSSGDYGVAGNGGQCIDPTTGQYNNGTSGKFNPSFPGTCPYVTSVGATQINPGNNVLQPETACEQVIYSGGGFSNNFAMPSYQKTAIANYYAKYNPPYGADRYNNSRMVRGYPDISANGANYLVALDGGYALVYGTSASSPVTGSILTGINEVRLDIGKKPIGFINPVLYQHPEVLFDITSGGNQGCGTPGFTAVPGWDPVTGLGTPNFPKMLALFLSLP